MTFARPFAALSGMTGIRWLMFGVLALGVLSLQTGRGTLAYFTSTASSTNNTFTAGTVTINVADVNETAAASITGSISAANTSFRPGQTVVGYITPSNAGTLPFDYGLKYTLTNGGTALIVGGATDPTLQVFQAAATTDCTSANVTGSKTNLTNVYSAAALSTTASTVVLDSSSVATGGVGQKRSLAASGSEVLCLAVFWPNGAAGAENAQQGGSATVSFDFDARQQ